MFKHVVIFDSLRDYGRFVCEVGTWWDELATFHNATLDPESLRFAARYCSENAIDKERQIDIQGAPTVASAMFNLIGDEVDEVADDDDDESTIPFDSQLAQDAMSLVAHYFPGSTITSIQNEYHRGVFVGDFSIRLICNVDHPFLKQVTIGFNQEDLPIRAPKTWKELCSLHIDLFITRFSLINPAHGNPITYSCPRLYQEDIEAWCAGQDDGELYGCIRTSEMFIITTQLLSEHHEDIERAAEQITEQAKAKVEQYRREVEEHAKSAGDDPFLPDAKE